MPPLIIGLRPGDRRELDDLAERVGRPSKEVAGILLEQAIRREFRNAQSLALPVESTTRSVEAPR